MEEAIRQIEKKDGLRLTWNVWPTYDKKNDILMPITCIYTPLQPGTPILNYEPVFCGSCRSVIHPFTAVDFQKKEWSCSFCGRKNSFPMHYHSITPESLPPELIEDNTTVEYVLSRESRMDPVYLFLIDTCTFDQQRHELLVEGLKIVYQGLPMNSKIGIITFGTNIEIHDLNSANVYLFSGRKEYDKAGLDPIIAESLFKEKQSIGDKFIEFLDNLERDPFPVIDGKRPVRCTGSALSIALSICESLFKDVGLRLLLFMQGPCTFGPGAVASINIKDDMRGVNAIAKGEAVYAKAASDFYAKQATRMGGQGYAVDLLAATLDDIGLYEMRSLAETTGGIVLMAQDFDAGIFTSSCRKLADAHAGFNAKIKINCSSGLSHKSYFGHGCKIGSNWRINALSPQQTISFLLECKTTEPGTGYVQIITQYQRTDRKLITRVTTFARLIDYQGAEKVAMGFDQEAACVFQARVFTFPGKIENDNDMVRRLDRSLIKFMRKYGDYQREEASSVRMPASMAYFPYFIYFLRRSVFIQTEANSPDEIVYQRMLLNRERVTEAMTMIVPTLTSYHYQGYVVPASMDTSSLQSDAILLLDTFYNVVIWKGDTIAEWIRQDLHKNPEYKYLMECIDNAYSRARELVDARMPTPQFTETERYGSQERLLLSRINPNTSNDVVITDDIDYDNFYKCLCQIVVDN